MTYHGFLAWQGTRLGVAAFRVAVASVLLGWGVLSPATGQAQTGSGWSPPKMLYDGMVQEEMSALVSDPFGGAHVVWMPWEEATYYYSHWSGKSWTTPIDVIAGTDDVGLGPPSLVAAADGTLHLFWAQDDVMHSWAWADGAANSARSWSAPEAVVVPDRPAGAAMDAKQDRSGTFHLVYSAGPYVYYVRSYGRDLAWTEPVQVNRAGSETAAGAPRLDVGSDGRVHVIWDEWPSAVGPAEASEVYYAHSTDGGRNWSTPQRLGELANRGGNVLAAEDGTVYLAWQAGILSPNSGRFLMWSSDGGSTWIGPASFSRRKGQSGCPSMALDSQGTLHVLTGDGEYAFWDGRSFSTSVDLRPNAEDTEKALLTVVRGNQVLVFIGPDESAGRYYTLKELPVPAVATLAVPDLVSPLSTSTPRFGPTDAMVSNAPAEPMAAPQNLVSSPQPRLVSTNLSALLFSSGLVLALVVAMLIVQFGRQRH